MRHRFLYPMVAVAMSLALVVGCQSAPAAQPAAKAAEPTKASAAVPAKAAEPTAAPAAAPAKAAEPTKPAEKAAAPKVSTGPVDAATYPDKPFALDNSGNAGGGLDLFNRTVEEALRKENLFKGTMTVTSYGGGGGNTGMSFLNEQKGSGYIMMSNTNRVYLNPMMGTTKLTLDDFVPVARLMTDYMIVAVRKDSPFKTGKDLMDALVKDPRAVTLGVGSAPPSNDHLNLIYAAKAAGVNVSRLNIVTFSAGGDLNAQLLGGHVGAGSTTVAESLPQYKSGDIRFLAISAPERSKFVPDVPTWKELGYQAEVKHWRAFWGPKDMPEVARKYWIDTFTKMVKTDTWKQLLERNGWEYEFAAGDDLAKAMKEEAKLAEDVLGPLGILPPKK